MDGLFERLRSSLKAAQVSPDGKRIISRAEAAHACADAIKKGGVGAIPYVPRGDAGRVAVVLVLIARARRVPLGWIEIPLTGDVVLNLDESSVAAAYGPRIGHLVTQAFTALTVRAVPADARTWSVGGARVSQSSNGTWIVTTANGALLAACDTPAEALRAAEARPAESGSVLASAGEVRVEMERNHAARWVAKQLREHGYDTHVDQTMITLHLPSGAARIDITAAGLVFDLTVPTLARTIAEAALRSIGVVERLG